MEINWHTPENQANKHSNTIIDIKHYHWEKHYRGLFNLPIAA